jgi:hypothetical protein
MSPIRISIGKERSIVLEPGQTITRKLNRYLEIAVAEPNPDDVPDFWHITTNDRPSLQPKTLITERIFIGAKQPSGHFYSGAEAIEIKAKYEPPKTK